ncbi:Interleukin-26 [Tupaia chinensis]|uniref:Interleukin-26 n=1 Tax=Tupaia chinensis TaxID=246437 RepID=L9KW60_TUPCH|nr:Interleukin-26 [Tupaia chinensis]
MWVNHILKSGLLLVTLSLAMAKHNQSSFTKSCYPRGILSQAVDGLYIKAACLKATIPKNCSFREQILSFYMEDVFAQLQFRVCKETHFVEDFHSLRQKLSHCIGNKGVYKAVSELDILLSWIKSFLESI